MLRSDLCDFSDAYIVVTGNITVTKKTFTANDIEAPNNTAANAAATNTANDNAFGEKKLVAKNNAPFINCISKINRVNIDNAEDLDVVMPMYNLLEYSRYFRKTTGSLWNYYRDEPSSSIDDDNITHSILNSESFHYKAKHYIIGNTENDGTKNGVKIAVPLKYLSNFWRSLEMPLINCKVELSSKYEKCLLTAVDTATFEINDAKIYVPIVTLKVEDNSKLSKLLNEGFKKSIYWNEYKVNSNKIVEIAGNNGLKYIRELLDSSCQGVNKLFVLAYDNTEGNNQINVVTATGLEPRTT